MKRRPLFLLLAAAALGLGSPSQAADAKRVLILGDSISIGYTPVVQKLLEGQMTVVRPMNKNGKAENCSDTKFGVASVDRWLQLEGGKWDVIHFNWGLHDIKHMKADGKTVSDQASDPVNNSVEVYEKNLREIVAKLKASGAKLVFATTTPVPDQPMKVFRSNPDVIRYNEAALRVMKDNQVAVNDLYAFVHPQMKQLQIQPANVHFTPAGSQALGAEVVKAIQAQVK